MHSSTGGWNLARGWVRSLGAVIMVALAVVETLLLGRLGFLLAEANANNGFVNFIYDVSKPLAEPFQGIVANSGNLEYASVIAMGVYAVAALLLIAALFAITAGPGASRREGRYQPHGCAVEFLEELSNRKRRAGPMTDVERLLTNRGGPIAGWARRSCNKGAWRLCTRPPTS